MEVPPSGSGSLHAARTGNMQRKRPEYSSAKQALSQEELALLTISGACTQATSSGWPRKAA
ncbi:hypothetical protein D3C87_1845240 [compost metagenome]